MRWLERLRRRPSPTPDAMMVALQASQRGDYPAALAIWEPLARHGHARAQNNIGACFAEGLGVERNVALALKWLSLASVGDDPVGQRNCAALYFRGELGEPDNARAAALYRQAAEQGDAPAQDMLSWMLLEGDAMPADPSESLRWAQAAADAGVASSMTRIGMLYHNALGVTRDPAEAVRWWRKGANAGDADGQAMLGAATLIGNGVEKDPRQALVWLLRAEAGGSTLAQPFIAAARGALEAEEIAQATHCASLSHAGLGS